jgi:hypothetical protein
LQEVLPKCAAIVRNISLYGEDMEIKDVANFEQFEGAIISLQDRVQESFGNENPTGYFSNFLYRGQGNSTWGLTTTLERFLKANPTLFDYYKAIAKGKSEIETFIGKDFSDFPDYSDYRELTRNQDTFGMREFPGYAYMAYLRHHGFPSPLLDWTRSPYIALYFAFVDVDPDQVDKVSVYAYQEWTGGGKTWSSGDPLIQGLGHWVKSHPRHFQQQSEYTVCMKFDEDWRYANHEDVFSMNPPNQDSLNRIDVPTGQKRLVLRKLLDFNIHHYSLFGSEDSLMKSMAVKNLYLA